MKYVAIDTDGLFTAEMRQLTASENRHTASKTPVSKNTADIQGTCNLFDLTPCAYTTSVLHDHPDGAVAPGKRFDYSGSFCVL
jgi:hypothetical protein